MLGNAMGNTTGGDPNALQIDASKATMQPAALEPKAGTMMASNQQPLNFNQGPYTAMGQQGSAGALGAQQPNPYMQNPYSKFGPVG
jgi:hypothetical protein